LWCHCKKSVGYEEKVKATVHGSFFCETYLKRY